MKIEKIIKFLKNPLWIIVFLNNRGLHFLSDKKYLKLLYRLTFGKKLNLKDPKTFNEKLQWLKLYDRKAIYTLMVDKYEVKEYVAKIIGKKFIIPTLGIYNKFDEIEFDELPNEFVIKCTHDSGGLIICKDKTKFDKTKAKKKISRCLKNDFYYSSREWPYKNVKKRIIVEKYMATENQKELIDYKFFCFNGEPKFLYISEGLSDHSTAKISFADMNYKKTEFYRNDYTPFDELPPKPNNFENMKQLAKKLAQGIPFVRVDLYEIEGKIYFGELTFYPGSGYIPFNTKEWDIKLGKLIEIDNEKKEKK